MIKISVKDFQSIEEADLEIEGLTILTGCNNAGKSALVRAFHAAVSNAPAGNRVRLGKDFSEVSLSFSDQETLLWRKGEGHNEYVLNGQHYENVGRGTFEEVSSFGILPIECGKKVFWPQIARQQDHVAFVLDESGSAIAESVVSDLDKVARLNRATSMAEKEKRQVKAEVKTRKKDLEEIEKNLSSWNGFRDIKTLFDQKRKSLEDLLRIKKSLEEKIRISHLYREKSEELNPLTSMGEVSFPSCHFDFSGIEEKASLWMSYNSKAQDIQKYKDLSPETLEARIPSLDSLKEKQSLLLKIREIQTGLEEVGKKLTPLEEDLEEELKAISELKSKECPVCGRL